LTPRVTRARRDVEKRSSRAGGGRHAPAGSGARGAAAAGQPGRVGAVKLAVTCMCARERACGPGPV